MNILDSLINPPTTEHIALLNIIQVIAFLMFLPFIGMLFGGTILSVYFNSKYRRTKDPLFLNFSKDIIDRLTFSRNLGWGMGILPVFTITVIYAQFLYGAKVISVGLFLLSTMLYIASFIFIYNYKNTFHIENVLKAFKTFTNNDSSSLPSEVREFEINILKSNVRYGNFGMWLLIIASFLFVGSYTIASDPGSWESNNGLMSVFLNGQIWLNFFYFVSASFAISGGAILYLFFIWQGGIKDMDDKYKSLSQKTGIYIALIASLVQPFFLILNFINEPQAGLTGSNFFLSGISIVSILLVCNFLYAALRNSEIKYASPAFFLIFLTFIFSVIQQQMAFGNSIKPHLYTVTQKAEELKKEIEGKTISTTGVDPEAIYNTKCIACHKFDVKLVGPPYQETVPKYAGDVKKLAEFIYNPQKIDPAFPPMPNQGLKQKEADVMAQWLIKKVSGK